MPLVQIGVIAFRDREGDFIDKRPIYKEAEKLTPEGFTPYEKKTLDEFSLMLAYEYRDYLLGFEEQKGRGKA